MKMGWIVVYLFISCTYFNVVALVIPAFRQFALQRLINSRRPAGFSPLRKSSLLAIPNEIFLKQRSELVEGTLENGLKYLVLPKKSAESRFEVHLEVLSGSAMELENQQGMAHILEHICYMGSPSRQRLAGTGSKSNAYTDFHQTVFFAGCPTELAPSTPMLPMALNSLLDVMQTNVSQRMLDKERAAVLSEAALINKIDYRVEHQILSNLHTENRISRRFPIGKEDQIKSWTTNDVQLFHDMHYRPNNAILYFVGDIPPEDVINNIKLRFESLRNDKVDYEKIMKESNEFPKRTMHSINRHFPPTLHRFSGKSNMEFIPQDLILPESKSQTELEKEAVTFVKSSLKNEYNSFETFYELPTPKIFKHDLLQSLTFHFMAKFPLRPVRTEEDFLHNILLRLWTFAIQIRINILQRNNPMLTYFDISRSPFSREGCDVLSLDFVADHSRWQDSVKFVFKEMKRLKEHGIKKNELKMLRQSLFQELVADMTKVEQQPIEMELECLMLNEARGNVHVDSHNTMLNAYRLLFNDGQHGDENGYLDYLLSRLNQLSMEWTSVFTSSLMQYDFGKISSDEPIPASTGKIKHEHIKSRSANLASALVVSCSSQGTEDVDADKIVKTIATALDEPTDGPVDIEVPDTLYNASKITKGTWKADYVPLEGSNDVNANDISLRQRQLSNGVRVNLASLVDSAGVAILRLNFPGGKLSDPVDKAGIMNLLSTAIQESGQSSKFSREQVELFCVQHQLRVEMNMETDCFVVDISVPLNSAPGNEKTINPIEALIQVGHLILYETTLDRGCFDRGLIHAREEAMCPDKDIESFAKAEITKNITKNDHRFRPPSIEELQKCTLTDLQKQLKEVVRCENCEITFVSPEPIKRMEDLILQYFSGPDKENSTPFSPPKPESFKPVYLGFDSPIITTFSDSEKRAVCILAGRAPNQFGFYENGSSILDLMGDKYKEGASKQAKFKTFLGNFNTRTLTNSDSFASTMATVPQFVPKTSYRDHPMYAHMLMSVGQEMINRHLFAEVREYHQLTYETNFEWAAIDRMFGGTYSLWVTTSPERVHAALQACKDTLIHIKQFLSHDQALLSAVKNSMISKHRLSMTDANYWTESLFGTSDTISCSNKRMNFGLAYEHILKEIELPDMIEFFRVLNFHEKDMTALVGISEGKGEASSVEETALENDLMHMMRSHKHK